MRKQSDASDVQSAIDLSGATMTKLVNYLKSLKFRQEYHEVRIELALLEYSKVGTHLTFGVHLGEAYSLFFVTTPTTPTNSVSKFRQAFK